MPVSVDLRANTGSAQKELEQFSKKLTGLAKLWEGAFGGRGNRTTNSNLQQLSKGVDKLGKDAERAAVKVKQVNDALAKVTQQRKALEGTVGAVNLKDREAYKLLTDQEKMLGRQQKTWAAIAANRNLVAQNAGAFMGGVPPPGGGGGRGGNLFNWLKGGTLPGMGGSGALAGRFASPLQQFAQTVGGGLGGPGVGALIGGSIGAAIGGLVVHAIRESMDTQKEAADFIPRMRPGALAGTNAFGLTSRMRGVGMPFGFNTRESMAVFQAMSEGGSNFGGGLERDARAAMQFGRMFGIDAGGEASMLATAQRTGAFRAGDAKRFAGMLASEISRTGLGPRAQEVQEATLMLLNQQMHTLGGARPGPMMALQEAFAKTGIPALTGMAGAQTISYLQDAVTNPQSEASEALNFSVFRRMGAKNLYDVKFLQEEGLNNPKYLNTLMRTVEESAPNASAADLALKEHTGGALNLHILSAIRARNGGRLSGFTGNLAEIMKEQEKGGGFLAKGGAGAMELPGNQLRRMEAHLHDLLMKFGEPATAKLVSIASTLDKTLSQAEGIAKSSATTAQKVTTMADLMMRQMGIDPNSKEFHEWHNRAARVGGFVESVVDEVGKSRQFEKTHPGQVRRLGQIAAEKMGLAPGVVNEVGPKWHTDQYDPEGRQIMRFPKGQTPVLPDARHVTITINDNTAESHSRLTRVIDEHLKTGRHNSVRSKPNTRNQR